LIVGIVLAAVSLVVMPLLSWAQKRRTGRELGSRSAVADSKQTLLSTYLSVVLLAGLLLNSIFGWSWADSIAGLVIAAVAVREGTKPGKTETAAAHSFRLRTPANRKAAATERTYQPVPLTHVLLRRRSAANLLALRRCHRARLHPAFIACPLFATLS